MVKKAQTHSSGPKTNREGFDLVLAFYEGNATKMAEAIGVTRQLLYVWRDGEGIPNKRVDAISRLTGIPREHIKPNPYK